MLIYIHDMLIVGNTEAVDEAIQVLQQSFEVRYRQLWKIVWECRLSKAKMVKLHGYDNIQLSKA